MNKSERIKRNERIAEIAKEILSKDGHIADYMDADVVKAVDDARRGEYYERLEEAEANPYAWGILYAAIDDSPVIQEDIRPGDWPRLKYGALEAMHALEEALQGQSMSRPRERQ